MRLLIDIQSLQTPASAHRGVGRYTRGLIKALIAHAGEHEVFVAANAAFPDTTDQLRSEFLPLLSEGHFLVWHQLFQTGSSPAGSNIRRIGSILRERYFDTISPDFVFSPNLQEGLKDNASTGVRSGFVQYRFCTTLHDVVPLLFPFYLGDLKTRLWYGEKLANAAASDVLLTVSETSRNEISRRLRLPPSDIHVVGNGFDSSIFNSAALPQSTLDELRENWSLPLRYLLYYGGADYHKNLEFLVSGFGRLQDIDVELVLVGRDVLRNAALAECISQSPARRRIRLLGSVPDHDLSGIIKMSLAVILPSRHEGFGLPALEAMACGTAVIGSKDTSIGEVIGLPEALFDSTDETDMCNLITNVVTDQGLREHLAANGLLRASGYSWDISAEQLWTILERDLLNLPSLRSSDRARRNGWPGGKGGEVERFVQEIKPLLVDQSFETRASIAVSAIETFSWRSEPRVFLDISTIIAFDHRSGIQRVVRAIASALFHSKWNGRTVQLVSGRTDTVGFVEANDYLLTGKQENAGNEVEFCPGDTLVYLDLNPALAISRKLLNRHLRRKQVRTIFVVYDLLPVLRPLMFWPALCQEFEAWLSEVSAADTALCISQTVATELESYVGVHGVRRVTPLRIEWFHLGADIQNSKPSSGRPADAEAILESLRVRPTFLMVGTLEPRKGHLQALQACEELWERGVALNLVIVGREGWGVSDLAYDLANHPQNRKRLFWLPGVSDEFLEELYIHSTCLLAASEAEGFGLPLIEASARGLPLLVKDIPVFREVASSHASYFPNTSKPIDLAEAMASWLRGYENSVVISSAALPRLTWTESASQFVQVLTKPDWFAAVVGGGLLRTGEVQLAGSERLEWHDISSLGEQLANAAYIKFSCSETTAFQLRVTINSKQSGNISISVSEIVLFHGSIQAGTSTIVTRPLDGATENLEAVLNWDGPLVPGDLFVQEFSVEANDDRLAVGESYSFESTNLAWFGFGLPELSFRWTVGHRAWLCFKADHREGLALKLKSQSLGKQRVFVSVNHMDVSSFEVEGLSDIVISLSQATNDLYTIGFHLPDARVPSLSDLRELGLAIISLELAVQSFLPKSYL